MITAVYGSELTADISGVVNLMPCKISSTGPAAVSEFFIPTVRPQLTVPLPDADSAPSATVSSRALNATFRGRPLNGDEIPISSGYTGIVLKESCTSLSGGERFEESAQKKAAWDIVGKFSALTYWNWDKVPSDDDGMFRLLQWTRIAKAVQKSARSQMDSADSFVDSDNE